MRLQSIRFRSPSFRRATASALMTAICAMTSSQATAQSKSPAARGNAPVESSAEQMRANVPSQGSALSSALVAEVMLAEIAAKRGEIGPAYRAFLHVAQETRDPRLARRAVELAVGARDVEGALIAVKQWAQLAPLDREADSALTALLIETGRFDDAEPKIAARLKESGAPGPALEEVQRLYAQAGDRTAAFASLERLSAPYANDARVHLALARMAYAASLNDRALQEAREAMRLDPHSDVAVLTAAQLLSRNDDAQAERLLKTFSAAHPDSSNTRIALARLYASQERYEDARAILRDVVQRDPDDLDALLALGAAEYQVHDLAAAEKTIKRYVARIEQSEDTLHDPSAAYLTLSQIAEEQRRFDQAIDWMNRIEAPSLGVRTRIAQMQVKAGRAEQGLSSLRAVEPANDVERRQLASAEALVLREAKRYQAAYERLEQALKMQPNSPDLLYDYALAAEKLNKIDVMERALRRVMELRPNEPNAYNALGYSLADRRMRLDEARALVEKAVQLAPDDPYIADSLGWVEYRAGNLPKSIEILERAYKLRPDAEIAAHLGEVLWAAGKREKAEALWRKAKERDPENETLVETLARYQQR